PTPLSRLYDHNRVPRANSCWGGISTPVVAPHRPGVRAADRFERGHSVVAESADTRQLHDHPGAEEHAGYAVRSEQRRAALDLRRSETPLREGEPGSGTVRRGFE
ncbi:hypothetical protein, partial [Kitasatospora purpeofusca]